MPAKGPKKHMVCQEEGSHAVPDTVMSESIIDGIMHHLFITMMAVEILSQQEHHQF